MRAESPETRWKPFLGFGKYLARLCTYISTFRPHDTIDLRILAKS